MNNNNIITEADTRAELIDPKLIESGWKNSDKIRIAREYSISAGRIIDSKNRGQKLSADYALIYKNDIVKAEMESTVKPMMSKMYEKLLDDLINENKSSPIFTHHINYINKAHYNDCRMWKRLAFPQKQINLLLNNQIS
jgi:type I site-specific restriction endonuclease